MEDYNIKASKIKSLIRHWRARGVSPGDTMKLMMLYLGTDRFLNSEMVYDRSQFNRIRKDLGFRTIPALLDIIRKSQLQKTVDIHPPKTGISVHFSD